MESSKILALYFEDVTRASDVMSKYDIATGDVYAWADLLETS